MTNAMRTSPASADDDDKGAQWTTRIKIHLFTTCTEQNMSHKVYMNDGMLQQGVGGHCRETL